jgi:hypothetical protein
VSLTAGTVLHNTKTPLTTWFWAAYLMVTDKRGASALWVQRQLALRRYEEPPQAPTGDGECRSRSVAGRRRSG